MKPRLFLLLVLLWVTIGICVFIKFKPVRDFKLPPPSPKPINQVELKTVPRECSDTDLRAYVDQVLRGIVMYPRFAINVNGQTYTYKLIETKPTGESK